jgi:hypothetical protein
MQVKQNHLVNAFGWIIYWIDKYLVNSVNNLFWNFMKIKNLNFYKLFISNKILESLWKKFIRLLCDLNTFQILLWRDSLSKAVVV